MTLARLLVSLGWDVEMQSACGVPELLDRARGHGLNVKSLHAERGDGPPVDAGPGDRSDWVCLDGYRFTEPDYVAARSAGDRLLVIDDAPRGTTYPADIVLDQNYGAIDHAYDAPGARLLLGTAYALIRPEIVEQRATSLARDRTALRSIVVTFGGSDPAGATLKTVEALARTGPNGATVTVIAGPANSQIRELGVVCGRGGFRLAVNPPDMEVILSGADAVICASGTTMWEVMCLGVPALVLTIADNQVPAALALSADSLIGYLGGSDDSTDEVLADAISEWLSSPDRLAAMGRAASHEVDGRGSSRVVRAMTELTCGDRSR